MEIKTPYPKPKEPMKSDLQKLIMFIWLAGSAFILYEIWANVSYIADMMEGYLRMTLGAIKK